MTRLATTQIDPLEIERRAYESLFDLMEDYRAEHPEASDDDIYEAVCFHIIPEKVSNAIDYEKERNREQY